MKVIENTLDTYIGEWSDPGDYPSGAGAGPLPSYKYVEAINGGLVVEVTRDELADWGGTWKNLDEFIQAAHDSTHILSSELPGGVTSVKGWDIDGIHSNRAADLLDLRINPAQWTILAVCAVGLSVLPFWLYLTLIGVGIVSYLWYINYYDAIYTVTISPKEFIADDHIDTCYNDYDDGSDHYDRLREDY